MSRPTQLCPRRGKSLPIWAELLGVADCHACFVTWPDMIAGGSHAAASRNDETSTFYCRTGTAFVHVRVRGAQKFAQVFCFNPYFGV